MNIVTLKKIEKQEMNDGKEKNDVIMPSSRMCVVCT